MDRYHYRERPDGSDEPVFRSDVEPRAEAPSYGPARPEGGFWSVVKKLLAPLAAVGMAATFVPDPAVLR